MKAIVYSLFGYNKATVENSFPFNSYLRGLMINIRLNSLLYPDWYVILETDKQTCDGFSYLFESLAKTRKFIVHVNEPAKFTKAMLWRLKPIFLLNNLQIKVFTHILCRDLDSPTTYRDAQAVRYWMNRNKGAHAITDSVSHNLPMLGGMIGFVPAHFTMLTGFNTWDEMFNGCSINFDRKGGDQEFLNQYIYPKFAQSGKDSITQHYFNGMGNSFLSDYKTCTCPPTSGHKAGCENDMDLGLPFELKEANSLAGHIGAAGWYGTATSNFINKHRDKFEDLIEIESKYSDIFSWVKNGCY